MSANSFHRRNGPVERGLYWKKTGKDVLPVVKGVSRQVIVVKEPDPRFFEQAIFILKEDAFGQGVTAEQVLQEARRVADGYVRKNTGHGRLQRRIPGPVYAAAGALGATACWCAAILCQGGLPL